MLQPTSPLRAEADIEECIDKLMNGNFDVLYGLYQK